MHDFRLQCMRIHESVNMTQNVTSKYVTSDHSVRVCDIRSHDIRKHDIKMPISDDIVRVHEITLA